MKKKVMPWLLTTAMAATMIPTSSVFAARRETEFSQNFEEYETREEADAARGVYVTTYANSSGSGLAKFVKEYTGIAANTARPVKTEVTNPFADGEYTIEGDGMIRPSTYITRGGSSYCWKVWDNAAVKFGGLPGYFGFAQTDSYPIYIGFSGKEDENRTYDLCVVKENTIGADATINNGGTPNPDDTNENKVLYLRPLNLDGQNVISSVYSMFAKENLELENRKSVIRCDVNIRDEAEADAFRLSIAKETTWATANFYPNFTWYNANHIQINGWESKPASMYDAVIFKDGHAYLGPDIGHVKTDGTYALVNAGPTNPAYICDYSEDRNYTIEYYLNLEDINNPTHMARIIDEAGNIIGEKSAKLELSVRVENADGSITHEGTNTTLSNPQYYLDSGYTASQIGHPADATRSQSPVSRKVYFSEFKKDVGYTAVLSYAQQCKTTSKDGPVATIDNFSLGESNASDIMMVTNENYYVENPIPFYNADNSDQVVELEFDYGLINNVEDIVSVTDAAGNEMDCTVTIEDGVVNGRTIENNTIKVAFPNESLEASSNYKIKLSGDTATAMSKLGEEKEITVRTEDKLSMTGVSKSGTTLTANISNNDRFSMQYVVAVVVRNNNRANGSKVFYKLVNLEPGNSESSEFEGVEIPNGAHAEVFCFNGFDKLITLLEKGIVE